MAVFGVLACRWLIIVQPLARRPVREHVEHYFFATFLNTFTPANIGGDAYRILSLRSPEQGASPVIIAVVRERVSGLLSYLLACPLVAMFAYLTHSQSGCFLPAPIEAAVIASSAVAMALLVAPLVTTQIARMRLIQQRPLLLKTLSLLEEGMRFSSLGRLSAVLALSFIGVALWITAVKIVAMDLTLVIPWPELGLVVILSELLRMLPTTIQGVGMREAAFAYLVGQLGSSPEAGFVLGATSYLILTGALALCGGIGAVLMQVPRGK
jgi:uncharacterized protein (TIRG00374 family)